jgi:hypothetical protein
VNGRWATAIRVLLVVAAAAAAVIVANVALLGVVENTDEPVGKLRPGIALTTPAGETTTGSQEPPLTATTTGSEESGDTTGGRPDTETGEGNARADD